MTMETESLADLMATRVNDGGDADRPEDGGDIPTRFTTAWQLGQASTTELAYDLMEPVTECLGSPCEPFVPRIRLEASSAIEKLEKGHQLESGDVGVLVDLVGRLLGVYHMGGDLLRPEMGWRLYPATQLNLAAAGRICVLCPEVGALIGIQPQDAPAIRMP